MKKVLVCALAVFFLMASCSTAFAATANSVTTYKSGDTSKFTVTTTVADVTDGDKVTYLAYKDSKTAANVTYADQKTVSGSTVTFSFDATPEDVAVTDLQFGTDSTTVAAPAIDDLADDVRAVTIKVNDANAKTAYLPETVGENSFFYVNGITIDSGYVVDHAEINGIEIAAMSAVDGSIILADDALIVANATINLILRAVDNAEITISDVEAVKFNNGADYLTVYAKVTGINNEEYGIKLKVNDGAEETYQAVAMGDEGQFAVQIIDENVGALVDSNCSVTVYAGNVTDGPHTVAVVE